MRVAVLCFCCCAVTAVADDGLVQRVNVGDTNWADGNSWRTRIVPGPLDEVFVPGEPGVARSSIGPGTEALARVVSVGDRIGSDGTIELNTATLQVKGLPGRIYVGTYGGTGTFRQIAGEVVVQKSIQLGYRNTSSGRYYMEGGTLRASAILVGNGNRTQGELELVGSNCRVTLNAYISGIGQSRLKIKADAFGAPQIQTRNRAELNGSMYLDLSGYTAAQDEIVLIDNTGALPIAGGFSQVLAEGASHYELDYQGGDGNDLTLVRTAEPITSYALYAAHHKLRDPAVRQAHKNQDDDGDGLTNLAEYKLGSSPVFAESWDWSPTEFAGAQTIQYHERGDREDVLLVPQIQVDGQWISAGVESNVLSETPGGRLMEASYAGEPKPFRLHAELLPDSTQPLNVLLVVVDDLNDWVGCLGGHPQASTPNIDRLASRGCLFTNAHANGVICNVSRSSFVTGVAPSTSRVYRNQHALRENPVLQNSVTLPQHFGRNGFYTVATGKILHDPEPESWDIDTARGDFSDVAGPNPPATSRASNGLDWYAITHLNDSKFRDRKISNTFIQGIKNRPKDRPFFGGVGYTKPHVPWYLPARFFDRIPLEDVILPEVMLDDKADLPAEVSVKITSKDEPVINAENVRREVVRAYLAATSFSDEMLGRVIDWLDASPDSANTVIVLISDHGFHLGEKQHWRKQTLWSEVTRIPMIIVAPSIVRPGSRRSQPVSLLDLYPTLADITDTEAPPNQLEGTSLVPLMQDPNLEMNRLVLSTRRRNQNTLTDGNYRLVRWPQGGEEFYDLKADPNEWHNMIDNPEYQEIIERFRQQLPPPQ